MNLVPNKRSGKVNSQLNMAFGSLVNNQGLSLVEVLAAFLIIVVAVVGIYLGLVYAESQLTRNYHDRVAALLASGECDWQYYNKTFRGAVVPFLNKEVIINDYPGTDNPPLKGIMRMQLSDEVDVVSGKTLRYQKLLVEVVWNEPLLGERRVLVREDLFR